MSAVPPEFRHALSRVIGRSIPAAEFVADVIPDLERLADRLDYERKGGQRHVGGGVFTWQFSGAPEVVVQVFRDDGNKGVYRMSGGLGQAGTGDLDPTSRALARTMLQLALDNLDRTEPTTTTGRAL